MSEKKKVQNMICKKEYQGEKKQKLKKIEPL